MSDAPIITPVGNGKWQLVEEWNGIPAGFTTDGGSIPRLLWRALGPPIDEQTVRAYIEHDYDYQTGRVKRKVADEKLYDNLRIAGVGRIRAYTIYAGVRAFGASHYNNQTTKEKTMHKLIEVTTLAALCAIVAGCKSVTVTRHPATLAKVATADGGEKVATDSKGAPIVLDGGWEVEYFQHWNWQKFDAMSATAGAGVSFSMNGYEGGADASNLVKLVEVSFRGAAELTAKIGAAIATSGGSIAAEGGAKALAAAISKFIKNGGDASKATVTCANGNCTISDGTISEVCEDCCVDCTPTK